MKWYFGTLETAHQWNWGDFHPVPDGTDPSIRAVKRYAGYTQYMKF
jgi:hypothetical protein